MSGSGGVVHNVGSAFDVTLDVAAWDGAGAQVDLSCAAMFSEEPAGAPTGGLAHLDAALGGRLLELRREGHFTGAPGECLLISQPPETVAAKALLVVGLGHPQGWTPLHLREAVRSAATFALALGVRSAAFAPGMRDSGLSADGTAGAPAHMIAGLAAALATRHRLVAMGLAPAPVLERWAFDVGAERLEAAAREFREQLRGQGD